MSSPEFSSSEFRSLSLPEFSFPKVEVAVPKTAATVPTMAMEARILTARDPLEGYFESWLFLVLVLLFSMLVVSIDDILVLV